MLRIAKVIPQGFSEAEIRRTDNIMDKRQKDDTQSITKKTEDRVTRTPVLRKGRQVLLHMCHSSCYFCYKLGDKS